MTELPPGTLSAQAHHHADQIERLLHACLPDAPPIEIEQVGERYRFRPLGQNDRAGGVPLSIHGDRLGWLRLTVLCCLDSFDEWLAIDSSKVWLVAEVDSTPIFRFEYLRNADTVPHSHVQVHGQRGALSHLLSRAGHHKPHEMSALHLPTGGARFRPGLEDVLQFLIQDCGFTGLPGWQAAVNEGRQAFRRSQLKASVRALPRDAASALSRLGYTVAPPDAGHPPDSDGALHAW